MSELASLAKGDDPSECCSGRKNMLPQNYYLVGGIPTILKKMMEFVSWDDDIPN
jgi:hypothetical protein